MIKLTVAGLFDIGMLVNTAEVAERDGGLVAEDVIDVLEGWWWLLVVVLEGSFGLGVHRQY